MGNGTDHKIQKGKCATSQNSKQLHLLENRMWEIQKGERKKNRKLGGTSGANKNTDAPTTLMRFTGLKRIKILNCMAKVFLKSGKNHAKQK